MKLQKIKTFLLSMACASSVLLSTSCQNKQSAESLEVDSVAVSGTRALIIVDVQNDFLPGGALAVPEGDVIIPVINELQSEYDLVVATQDWHPSAHKSFAANHDNKQPFEQIEWQGASQTLWPVHCVQGSQGAEIVTTLNTERVEAVFRKGVDEDIDSYSAFFDNHRIKQTGLDGYLRGKGITEVYVCGLAADYCVYYTAMDALSLGYKTTILETATRSISPERFESLKQEFKTKGGLIK